MKTYKFSALLWGAGLLVGFLIVMTSIVMTVGKGNTDLAKASHKRMYFSKQILPDHTFYPVLVLVERAQLAFIDPADKPLKLLELADYRMKAAQELADKGEFKLAEQTLYKSHLYLVQAAEVIDEQQAWEQVNQLADQLSQFSSACEQLEQQIHPQDPSLFKRMAIENQVATDQIRLMQWSEH